MRQAMSFPVFFSSMHHLRSVPAAVAETEELFSIGRFTAAQSCHRLGSSCDGIRRMKQRSALPSMAAMLARADEVIE
jgi:hypothetical protein